jgi:hypothetical protein
VNGVVAGLGGTFGSAKQIVGQLRKTGKEGLGGESGVYRAVRALGFRFKEPKAKAVESEQLKDARVLFYNRLLDALQDDSVHVCNFDWTSFSPSNFKRRHWARTGEQNKVEGRYQYQKLHLLALLDSQGGVVGQFVKGSLGHGVVFCFLRDAVLRASRRLAQPHHRLVVILDNSPLNHVLPIKYFAVANKVSLLFTPPTSYFSNAVELLFAMLKAPLKKVFDAAELLHKEGNRFAGQPRAHESHPLPPKFLGRTGSARRLLGWPSGGLGQLAVGVFTLN